MSTTQSKANKPTNKSSKPKSKPSKKGLNAQDAKTLTRLLSTYGAGVILSEIGRKESKDLETKLSELTKAKLDEAKPTLEKFVAGAETLIKTKLLKHIEDLRKSMHTEPVQSTTKTSTKKAK